MGAEGSEWNGEGWVGGATRNRQAKCTPLWPVHHIIRFALVVAGAAYFFLIHKKVVNLPFGSGADSSEVR